MTGPRALPDLPQVDEAGLDTLSPAAAVRMLRELARADHHRRGTQYVAPLRTDESAA
jgi:hypothetical protein